MFRPITGSPSTHDESPSIPSSPTIGTRQIPALSGGVRQVLDGPTFLLLDNAYTDFGGALHNIGVALNRPEPLEATLTAAAEATPQATEGLTGNSQKLFGTAGGSHKG